jgi:hypothetical protein
MVHFNQRDQVMNTQIIAAMVLVIVCGNAAVSSPAPLLETQEAQAAFKSIRTLETKIEIGMNLTDYGREVANMAVEIGPLDDVLRSRHADTLRASLLSIRQRYALALELWNACIQDRDNCRGAGELIDLNYQFPSIAAINARSVLAELPSANQLRAQGGVIEQPNGKQSFVFLARLLGAVWADAKTKGQGLKADMADAAPSGLLK